MIWEQIISHDFPAAVEQSKGFATFPSAALKSTVPTLL